MLARLDTPHLYEPAWKQRVVFRLKVLLAIILAYLWLSYWALPRIWEHYEHRPELAAAPKVALTREGIPGDPLNVAVVGTREEVMSAMAAAGWQPADPVTWRSSLGIGASVLLGRPYPTAPMSPLYVWNRPQDLSFQQPVGRSASQRHHVRFWLAPPELWSNPDASGHPVTTAPSLRRPLWVGAVTYDHRVGLSHYTGQLTHHIDANVDAERDRLIRQLKNSGLVSEAFQVTGPGATLTGRNGGGDWYFTDGEMTVALLASRPVAGGPAELPNPPAVQAKQGLFSWIRWLAGR